MYAPMAGVDIKKSADRLFEKSAIKKTKNLKNLPKSNY
jgi:hypothetical protein